MIIDLIIGWIICVLGIGFIFLAICHVGGKSEIMTKSELVDPVEEMKKKYRCKK